MTYLMFFSLLFSPLVECLSKVIQGIEISEGGGWEDIQNWLIAL